MSLDKAIAAGKEKRKPYRKSQAFDQSCRCHGSCGWCQGNRQHADEKRKQAAKDRRQPEEDINGE